MSDHLHRSRDDRMLAGVAGGLAEMWDADPSLVRLVWALLVIFTGGIALLVYIVMAIVVPEEDDEYVQTAPPAGTASYAPPEVDAGSPSTAMPDGSASPEPAATTPAAAAPPPTYWLPGSGPSRADARAARRAARRERRQRGDSAAPLIIGVFLVLIGGFFLAREWLPELDWDWFWPVMLIALGAVLLVLALSRRPSDPGDPS